MGRADIESKAYMSDPAHFADMVNYYVFGGEEVVDPGSLTPLDTAEIAIPYGDKARTPVQKYRDVIKSWSTMMDGEAVYIILGLINAVTGSNLKIVENEEGKIDMCVAIDEMRKESRDEGMIEGHREGKIEGRREGKIEGHREGKIEGALETLAHLVRKGRLSLYDAAMEANLTLDEFRLKMEEIK